MQAVRYRFSYPRYAAARFFGTHFPTLVCGRLSALSLCDQQAPRPRGPEWLVLSPIYAGICGTDVATLSGKASPLLAPFTSFPAVLGHEVVAVVTEAGREVRRARPGDRVVVDPFITCRVRGLPDCPACARGQSHLCRNAAEGPLAPGLLLGFCKDLPGAWSETMIAHDSQVFRLPHSLPDRVAVLVEPLAVAVHAVLRRPPAPGSHILVLGCGTIGLCVIAALRLLEIDCRIAAVARYPFQAAAARRLGADTVLTARGEALVGAAAALTGGRVHRAPGLPGARRTLLMGGFDLLYECTGSIGALDVGLRTVREGGTAIVIGALADLGRLDWTVVWARELDVLGSCAYGWERWDNRRLHTFELVLERLEARGWGALDQLVTHTFPLTRFQEAILTHMGKARFGAIKTVFAIGAARPPGAAGRAAADPNPARAASAGEP
ncbi:MAG TPA: alcohol dehydrogenase catalytic domain-containing protein [Limnochordia bacterium]